MKLLLKSLFIILSLQACSQQLTEEELRSREIASMVIDEYLKKETSGNNYIIFSSGDTQFVVLVQEQESYHEYYIDMSNKKGKRLKNDTILDSSNKLLSKMFDKNLYRQDYISFRSDFYKDGYETASGNITYFSLVLQDGSRYGESRLSVFVKPNPIDAEIYLYFVQRLLSNAGST